MLVFSTKSNTMFESSFASNEEAAAYLFSTRMESGRLTGFRKGLVQLTLARKEVSSEQAFHLHKFATAAIKKDERLAKFQPAVDCGQLDLTKEDGGLVFNDCQILNFVEMN